MTEVAVYTAVFGGYDRPDPPVVPGRFVAYSERSTFKGWENRHVQSGLEPRRQARKLKCLGMVSANINIWIDGNCTLLVEPERLAREWLGEEYDIALFRHPAQECIYDEAEVCKHKNKDGPEVIELQMARYRASGFPRGWGLGETTVLARRQGRLVEEFNARWWAEVVRGSVRDQLSFDYVRWVMRDRIRVNFVDGGLPWRKREHPWFWFKPHNGSKLIKGEER